MPITPKLDIDAVNAELETKTPQEILEWVGKTFPGRAALASSMQRQCNTLAHLIHSVGANIDVLFIDTQFHFPETLETRDRTIEVYGLNVVTLTPKKTPEEQRAEYGRDLYAKDGDYQLCCKLRKDEPFVAGVRGNYDIVVGGLMRAEGGKRGDVTIFGIQEDWDAYKINPLANWNDDMLDAYNKENDVVVHPLHEKDYPSIGCAPCTTTVQPGEDRRAGRWRQIREAMTDAPDNLYCGINKEDR